MYDQSECSTEEEKKDRAHFIYVSKKLPGADEVSEREFVRYIYQVRVQEAEDDSAEDPDSAA